MTTAPLTRPTPSPKPSHLDKGEGGWSAFVDSHFNAWQAEAEAWDYASLADVQGAAHGFPSVERPLLGRQYAVRFSPGTLAVRTTDAHRSLFLEPLPGYEIQDELDGITDYLERVPRVRDIITRWSAKSRRTMVRTIAELDFSEWDNRSGPLAMVTLTYPGDWLTVAPNAERAKAHLQALRKRWERDIGPWVTLWKQEFQRRGAPHFHLLIRVPAKVGNRTFEKWLSRTWADIVDHPDVHERSKHLRAGTGVDFSGVKFSDPKRAAIYFLKHSAKTRDDKEYQHIVPEAWRETGSGRWWGYTGLTKAVVEVPVSREVYYKVARILRHLNRARRAASSMQLLRQVGHHHTIARGIKKSPNRRGYSGGGWVILNDGVTVALQLRALLSQPVLADDRLSRTGRFST